MSDLKRPARDGRLWTEEAAHWWALLHGEGATAAEQREFLAWVARSPERIEAYLEIERLMTVLRADTVRWPDTPVAQLIREAKASVEPVALIAADPAGRPHLHAAPQRPGPLRAGHGRRLRVRARIGAAAAIALAAALAGWLWLPRGAQIYRTGAGEQRSVLLADGSRITLNADSAVEVQLRTHRRVLHLLRGEALFRVSHDPARPFDVHADGAVVRAIGTEFNVDVLAHYAAVTVLQGRVAVMSAAQARLPLRAAWRTPGGGRAPQAEPRLVRFPAPAGALILGVAQEVLITPKGLSAPRSVQDLTATTAWTHRQLVFEHRPLGEVVDELDRDGDPRIVIDSAALRARQVTGVIRLDDPSSLLEFLSDVPGVVIHHASDGISVVTLRRTHAVHMKASPSRMNPPHG